ncbi:ATP-binding protein [Euzebya tangerina]|uniref:ATP-binding protein n=1 Tax=Euzebya tangerina TaxID=591198 RepID=UPI000E30DC01|nr:ATP-binding protein [Euzebya tangerina]
MSRGRLRVYLGAAPGVGKTVEMLEEGHRLQRTGTDVVIGVVETHGRSFTADVAEGLEAIPLQERTHRGTTFPELDLAAVLDRRPEVALIDELAHTNVPGSANHKRHQDVEVLLEAGIDVLTTLNVQHLESVNDVVQAITGVRQLETVPDAVVRAAEEIELVDLTPEVLRQRLAAGSVYPAERIDAALGNFFRAGNLGALREIALMWLADRVEEAVDRYRELHGIGGTWETRERVVVALTGAGGGDVLIRRAARMAARGRGDLVGIHVRTPQTPASNPAALDQHRELLQALGGQLIEVVADDVADGLLSYARAEGATQIVLGATRRSRWAELVSGSVITTVLRGSGRQIDVHVISTGPDDEPERLPPLPRWSVIGSRRRLAGLVLSLVGLPLITYVFAPEAGPLGLDAAGTPVAEDALTTPLLLYVALIAVVAAVGGIWPALVAAAGGFVYGNAVFTEPRGSLEVREVDEVVALVVFLLIGLLTSALADLVRRRADTAARARAEVTILTRLAASMPTVPDPLDHVVAEIARTFDLPGVAVVEQRDEGWTVLSASGAAPREPAAADDVLRVDETRRLLLAGSGELESGRRLLAALAGQLASAVTQASLNRTRSELADVAASNDLRVALLSAVSHDLRTPLSGVIAAATSLLATDVELSRDHARTFAEGILTDAERLNRLITNLLDMSRLEAGNTRARCVETDIAEVLARAVEPFTAQQVTLYVGPDLPLVFTDPALCERVLANIVENAVTVSSATMVDVHAEAFAGQVAVRIVDRGPGIPDEAVDTIFRPFQRLGDAPAGKGIGLGLAIAKGFADAIGASLAVDPTPGGGTTMTLSLPQVDT